VSPIDLLGDVRQFVPAPWSEILLVAVSVICGALVGSERERQEKPAGFRTLILICVGATIFTLASLAPPLASDQPGRIAAQIVTGIGFLGAGSILRERSGIRGLTTAACIWATAGVGVIVGAGYAVPGLLLSSTILLTLAAVRSIEFRLGGACRFRRMALAYDPRGGKTRALLQRAFDESRGPCHLGPERPRPDGRRVLPFQYCVHHREHRALLAELAMVPGVEELLGGEPPHDEPA
jgi:putative Mg2+ transporter-C (MgtC) family protein